MTLRRIPSEPGPLTIRRPTPLSDVVAAARVKHAETIDAFVAWSAVMGRDVDPDVAALVHAVEDDDRSRTSHRGWDRASFYSFYRNRLWNWCSLADCDYPDDLPEFLWLWLHHRRLSGRWGADDEPLHELLKVLLCYGDIGFDGWPMPEGETRRLVPCECMVSRDYPPPPGPAPTIADLEDEAEDDLGPIERHR
ncbi:hypothetical protein [Actinomycetospora termitidis]|uniref:DUF4913 domain-containing protein n=1 Tax=Actinomycetospora termitidis TaxID=3053470 RepID=A0ABT7M4D4_9PSEU|nr:hypothetical protein [Actinomycetospora sp. Odt1-22]MDL5155543.1 hypothetical protein [Actinomycetospora sp. Odt1-22]